MKFQKRALLTLAITTLLTQVPVTNGAEYFSCPVESGVFAHPDDCVAYYMCTDWKASVMKCSAPLHFNPRSNNCDWPVTSTCQKGEYDYVEYAAESPEKMEDVPSDVVCPPTCVCSIEDPCHCHVYYRCLNGIPSRRECNPGLHFNPKTMVCDHPWNVNCKKYCPTTTSPTTTPPTTTPPTTTPPTTTPPTTTPPTTTPPTTTPPTTTPPTTTPPTTTPPTTTPPTTTPPTTTPPTTTPPTTTPPTTTPPTTTPPTTTPPTTTPPTTTPPTTTPPTTTPPTTTPPTTTPPTTTPPTTTTPTPCPPVCTDCLSPIKGNCSCYTKCENGHKKVFCCPHGLHFNRVTKTCDLPEKANCENKPTCPNKCDPLPDKCNCTRYWMCLDGVVLHLSCSEGLVYDPILQTCNWAQDVDCPDGEIPPIFTEDPHETTPGGWGTTRTTKSPPTPGTDGPPGGICYKGDGHYPHRDCTKFYHCSNGYAYVKDCPPPLHWSIKEDRCEWPCIARCDPKITPC